MLAGPSILDTVDFVHDAGHAAFRWAPPFSSMA